MKKNKLSVVIPVYNEEKQILDCLESLGNQTYSEFEIIVIDDGSTDKTLDYVNNLSRVTKKTTDNKMNLSVLRQDHLGTGAARNLGAEKAKGSILVFVDADMTFKKNFLEIITKPILKGKSMGTSTKSEYVVNRKNLWAKCWNINEGWPEKRRHPKYTDKKDKVFRAILKSEFEKVGGFTPGGYTDDYTLSNKLGYKADVTKAVVYHKNPDSLVEVFAQSRWAAKRRYKRGYLGLYLSLMRASLPLSVLIGGWKSFIKKQPAFLLFKIVYDLGAFIGILSYVLTGKGQK